MAQRAKVTWQICRRTQLPCSQPRTLSDRPGSNGRTVSFLWPSETGLQSPTWSLSLTGREGLRSGDIPSLEVVCREKASSRSELQSEQ